MRPCVAIKWWTPSTFDDRARIWFILAMTKIHPQAPYLLIRALPWLNMRAIELHAIEIRATKMLSTLVDGSSTNTIGKSAFYLQQGGSWKLFGHSHTLASHTPSRSPSVEPLGNRSLSPWYPTHGVGDMLNLGKVASCPLVLSRKYMLFRIFENLFTPGACANLWCTMNPSPGMTKTRLG